MPLDFPSPFSTSNPYANSAGSFASSAASVDNSIRAAETQQAILQQRAQAAAAAQQHQGLLEHFDAISRGGQPTYIESRNPQGMIVRTPNPDVANFHGETQRLSDGTSYTFPTDEDKERLKRGNNVIQYTDEQAAELNKTLGTQNIRGGVDYDPSLATHLDEALRLHNEAMDRAKAAANPPKHFELNTSGNFYDEKGNPVAVGFDPATNTIQPVGLQNDLSRASTQPPTSAGSSTSSAPSLFGGYLGQKMREQATPNGGGTVTFKPKAAVPKSLHWEKNTDDNGNVTLRAMDPENGKVIQTYNYKGEGLKRKNPGATPATKPPTRAQLTQVEVNKQKALNAGRLQFQKDLSEAITPEDKEAAATNYKAAVQEAQLGYEHELSTLLGKDVPHNSWTDQFRPDTGAESTQPSTTKPVPKPTVRPQTGGGQQPQTKTLSLADLHAYVAAQKKLNPSFTEEDARREAKQRGYSVQGDENLAQRKAASGK